MSLGPNIMFGDIIDLSKMTSSQSPAPSLRNTLKPCLVLFLRKTFLNARMQSAKASASNGYMHFRDHKIMGPMYNYDQIKEMRSPFFFILGEIRFLGT